MKFFQDVNPNINMIRSYSKGSVKINDNVYTSSLIVTGDTLNSEWPVSHVDQLQSTSFIQVCQLPIEVLLIGTGENFIFPNLEVLEPLREHKIGYEIMDTAAACRTYNIIVHDGRKVGAALIVD